MPHPDFAKAAAHITADAVRDCLADLVNIASPTGNEIGVAQYLVERMRKSGMETDLPLVDAGRPNAVGHLRGSGDGLNLLFTGHMDTSYSGDEEHLAGDGFKPKAIFRDGWMLGLGANNMKSGLASALVAIEAIVKAGIKLAGDISFGAVVGEIEKTAIEEFQGIEYSGYGVGSRHLVTHGVTADFAVLAEPTGMRIAVGQYGLHLAAHHGRRHRCAFRARQPAERGQRHRGHARTAEPTSRNGRATTRPRMSTWASIPT